MIEIVYHGEAAAAFGPDGQAGGFENADGNGEIHLYPLLDGVSAMCLRLEMGLLYGDPHADRDAGDQFLRQRAL